MYKTIADSLTDEQQALYHENQTFHYTLQYYGIEIKFRNDLKALDYFTREFIERVTNYAKRLHEEQGMTKNWTAMHIIIHHFEKLDETVLLNGMEL